MPDPLVVLPIELCTWFISFAIDGLDAGPLELLMVSRRWTRLLLNTPSLWSHIYVQNGEDEMARISTFLYFSRGCSLHVDVMTTLPTMDSLHLIANHISRVATISIRPSFADTVTALYMEQWKRAASRIMEVLSNGPLDLKDASCFGISLRGNNEMYYCIVFIQFTMGNIENSTDMQGVVTSAGLPAMYPQTWEERIIRCACSLIDEYH
jgi:hypothetical protein